MRLVFPKPPITTKRGRACQSGFSLAEMMIAITLGLLILAGLTSILVSNSRARNEIERANRQIENGRYALQMLTDDLRLAGYVAEYNPNSLDTSGMTALPDPCATSLTSLVAALPLHVQGIDNATNATKPSCISDLIKENTDILVVRRTSTCSVGSTDCGSAIAGAPYFQTSLCGSNTELNYTPASGTAASDFVNFYFMLNDNTASLTLHKKDCVTTAEKYRYRTHIYFVANNDKAGDGIPTLKRWELGSATNPVPLVEGIENFQIEYGIDNLPSFSGDGIPDVFLDDPGTITFNANTPDIVSAWRQIVSARIYLLARNTESTKGFTDRKTYSMDAEGTQFNPCNGLSGSALTDCQSYKRHVYQSAVRLNNPAGRRMP